MRSRHLTPLIEQCEPRRMLAGDLIHTTAQLSEPADGVQVAVIGNDAFFIGNVTVSRRSRSSAPLDIYDAHLARWYHTRIAAPAYASSGVQTFAAGPDLITLADYGNRADMVYVYNTQTGENIFRALSHGASVPAVVGDKVLFTGGSVQLNDAKIHQIDTVDVYDTSTGQWSTTTPLSVARYPGVTTVDDQALYVGANVFRYASGSTIDTTAIDIYNATTDTWSTDSLGSPIAQFASADLDHQAVIAGGVVGGDVIFHHLDEGYAPEAHVSAEADVYHADTGQLTRTTISQARENIATATVGNLALFAGGDYYTTRGYRKYPQTAVDVYNAQTGQWSTAQLSTPRTGASSAVAGNFALFVGGTSGSSATADLYDASASHWTTTTMPVPLAAAQALAVGNRVIVYSYLSPTLDVFDASTGTWSTAQLSAARRHVATATVGDTALFAGGRSAEGRTAAVDLYTIPAISATASARHRHAGLFA